jgi:hypothetical protein
MLVETPIRSRCRDETRAVRLDGGGAAGHRSGVRALPSLLISLLVAGPALAGPLLVDVTERSGVDFTHQAAHSEQYLFPETFGAGAALFDLEGDGDLDLLLLDSGSPPGAIRRVVPRHRLYRNDSTGPGRPLRFRELPAPALEGLTAMGACVGDVDGDGDEDLWVTGLPEGRLLLNAQGVLREAGPELGAADPGWSTACAFIDHERDGRLDLYSVHYLRWNASAERNCGGEVEGFRSYCPPDQYESEADRLFVGDGRGGFSNATGAAGLGGRGKGLGVVATDLDGDGHTDLAVANDGVANELWIAGAGGRYRDRALLAGTAFAEDGRAQAGMGTDAGDVDGDGRPDLWVSNLDLETTTLSLRVGGSAGRPRFRDAVHGAGLAEATLKPLGFGAVLADFDLDGDLDVFVANGHIIPEIARIRPDQTWAMEDQLFENLGGGETPRFRDARPAWLPAAADARVSRGVAVGDLDSDGDLDLVVTANGGAARILRNEAAGPGSRWLGLDLKATRSAPGAPGASARLQAGRSRLGLRRTGGSFLSASDTRIHFGLGDAPRSEKGHRVEITWTDGRCELFGPLTEGSYHRLVEGSGRSCPATKKAPEPPEGSDASRPKD